MKRQQQTLTDRMILRVAKLYREGVTFEEITKRTGIKSPYYIIQKLKQKGAHLPKIHHRRKVDWDVLVNQINKRQTHATIEKATNYLG